jgi:hypothetical protein
MWFCHQMLLMLPYGAIIRFDQNGRELSRKGPTD